jgi:uncharacterized protein (DUF433 family)
MNWRGHIVLDPAICHGKPTFRGTRVLVSTVIACLAAGRSEAEIRPDFPTLGPDAIRAALALASDVINEPDAMNAFEFGMVASPLAGLLAGARATAGHGTATLVAGTLGGLVIGAVIYVVTLALSKALMSRVMRGSTTPPAKPSLVEWLAGSACGLSTMASPVLAWCAAAFAVSRLLPPAI